MDRNTSLKIKKIFLSAIFIVLAVQITAQPGYYKKELNIPYYSTQDDKTDKYLREMCLLDIYYPESVQNYSTIIWFHGGGLTGGNKTLPEGLAKDGVCIVSVSYRLYPVIKCPVYIEDAAAAVAWVFNNIEKYGGNKRLIFVCGHSAGAYLTSMIGLDKKWLAANNIDADKIAGLFPLSGNVITHLAIRDEKGLSNFTPFVDEFAPLFHIRADAPPLILMTGDREMEMIGRYEENAYMMRMMKLVGHKETILYEFDGYGHAMTGPAFPLVFKHVEILADQIRKKTEDK